MFDPQLEVFRLTPAQTTFRAPELASTLRLTDVLVVGKTSIKAIISQVGQGRSVAASISGHELDGAPTTRPHIAVLPLPFVGGDWGDGHLMGFAIAVPAAMSDNDQRMLMVGLERLTETGLNLGSLGTWKVVPDAEDRPSMRSSTWTGDPKKGAYVWASVTPIAYDEHPKGKSPAEVAADAARLIGEMCERVSLPKPVDVRIGPASPFRGVPSAGQFPRIERKNNGGQRRQTHAIIEFEQPVVGPMLLGAGRFRGYGLMRPLTEGGQP